MWKKLMLGVAFATSLFAGPAVADAQTIKVLVVQEDWDTTSLARDNRIQRAVLNTWNETLNAPAYREILDRYGIQGMDVYDETAVSLNFYEADRVRRRDEELITLARQVKNPIIDVVVLYTLYARAVQDPYTHIAKLQMSMSYRALDSRSGRFFGGDNIDIDRDGVPLVGCATKLGKTLPDEHCVKEFVSEQGERLARDAGNALAIRLAALLGRQYGTKDAVNEDIGEKDVEYDPNSGKLVAHDGGSCPNIPTTFVISYEQFSERQKTFIEQNMTQWKCALDVDSVENSLANTTYEYKTRANAAQTLRNIRLMLELMGVVADTRNRGSNEIIVRAFGIREN